MGRVKFDRIDWKRQRINKRASVIEGKFPAHTKKWYWLIILENPRHLTKNIAEFGVSNYIIWISNAYPKPDMSKSEHLILLRNPVLLYLLHLRKWHPSVFSHSGKNPLKGQKMLTLLFLWPPHLILSKLQQSLPPPTMFPIILPHF